MKISAFPGMLGSVLVLVLVVVVVGAVIGAFYGVSDIASWDRSVPLFGTHFNMTGLTELQWHIFSLLIMLSAAWTFCEDGHVRVDVLSGHFSGRSKLIIDILGDLFLLLPFFGCLAWFSFKFAMTAYSFGEQSNSSGLIDRYLVKAVLPIGSGLMLCAGTGRILRNLGRLIDGEHAAPTHSEVS